MNRYFLTSESVTEGHPDKVADRISDAILDEFLLKDSDARVAVETLVKDQYVFVAGEITSTATIDIERTVRETIRGIGYTDNNSLFSADNCEITTVISKQSPDIAMGVDKPYGADKKEELGAGDQGMMFGFACNETEELMPLALSLAHKLAKRLSEVRKQKIVKYLRPDGKSQVTVEYRDNKAVRVDTVIISAQHNENTDIEQLREDIRREVIEKIIPSEMMDIDTKILINPTGRFAVGGPEGDCGLTGRKIIVDTYGGAAKHGGGCFSGKDATKVDRSGAYMARYIAKNAVKTGIVGYCELQIAYAIGVAKPVSINVTTDRGYVTDMILKQAILEVFDMSPNAIIEQFKLKRPIYKEISAYGHMGREDLSVPWEEVDMADKLTEVFEFIREKAEKS